jgi:hypothetical protein
MKQPAARVEKSEALRVLDQLVREAKAVSAWRTMSLARRSVGLRSVGGYPAILSKDYL